MHSTDLTVQEQHVAQSLLGQLLEDSRLYTTSADYKALLDFVVRVRGFAPFNAMLLHLQKPGLRFAASAYDWAEKFERTVNKDARPLLILWPFGPVALVYDLLDTQGKEVPAEAYAFPATGCMTSTDIAGYVARIGRKQIRVRYFDAGDGKAGSIALLRAAHSAEERTEYEIALNWNHSPNTQFATLVHELGHLFLGHLGKDFKLKIEDRRTVASAKKEIEAESVCYLVCSRNGVETGSASYLSQYVAASESIEQVDIYRIMRAAGQVEAVLRLTSHTRFDAPAQPRFFDLD